ncbi:MAG: Uma2 family endonuclease [Lachnospiraceae bacterium]|nr:Uma2 family endonuclease [Lachnospiraceae bacterium]
MSLPQERIYTISDIYLLPDGKRAELIRGEIYDMAPPSRIHQKILTFFSTEILLYLRRKKGDCEIYPAPFAVFLDEKSNTYVEPDISVICDKEKLDEKGCHGAPDWIIEIVSPSSKKMDYYTKLSLYKEHGVRDYWIVDPMKQAVVVYNLEAEELPVIYRFSDSIRANIYDDLEITLAEM